MGITDELMQKSNGILQILPEVSDSTKSFYMFDDGGIEVEVGEFLYGIVRVQKALRFLTTGVYSGISDMYLAKARQDNGDGSVGFHHALEIEPYHIERAKKLWQAVGVKDLITVYHTPSLEFEPQEVYDFMFLDSEPEIRFKELVRFFPNLQPGGFVFIHDLHRGMCQGNVNPDHPNFPSWPFGNLPEEIKNWVKDGELRSIHFSTPRGFMGFYKVHPSDHKWI